MKRLFLLLAAILCLTLPFAARGEDFLLADGTAVTIRENSVLLHSRWSDTVWYGDFSLPSDGTLPETHEELIALIDPSDWAYLAQDAKLARLLPDGSTVTDWYREGTPVKVLSADADGSVLAAVCGSTIQCRIPASLLAPADTQYQHEDMVDIWLSTWQMSPLTIPADASPVTICTQPDGPAALTLPQGEKRTLYPLASCAEEGWLHVSLKEPPVTGYVHIGDLPQGSDEVTALRLLPDYLNLGGMVGGDACAFLMRRPDGCIVFIGCERTGSGAWRITESQPIPEGAVIDSYHSDGDYLIFSVPDAEASALYGTKEWKEYSFTLQDGQWLLSHIYVRDFMDFAAAPMIYAQDVGTFFGSIPFDRNAATLDWEALPDSVEDLLAGLPQDWALLKADVDLLLAPGDTAPRTWHCHAGTPVQILTQHGASDTLAQVAVLGRDIRGWVSVSDLAFGAEQLVTVEYTEDDSEPFCYQQSLMDQLPWFDVPAGTPIHTAPDGDAAFITEWEESFLLMSESSDGWYHVYLAGTDSGFVKVTK